MRASKFCTILITLTAIVDASIYEDEDRVNSEGMWQKSVPHYETMASDGQGNSRFDVGLGGILTTIGLAKGASTLGLVVFPFLFPIVILLAIALFIISIFGGTAPFLGSGRRFEDRNGNKISTSVTSTNLYAQVLESEECIERIGCEILDRVGHKTKILRTLQKLSWFPDYIEKVDKAVTGARSCSGFKCRVKDFIARTWIHNYAKYFT